MDNFSAKKNYILFLKGSSAPAVHARTFLSFHVLALPFLLALLTSLFMKETHWVNEPIHSSIEAAGALIALILGFLILSSHDYAPGRRRHSIWIANSMICSGTFDSFHSILNVSSSFFWTRALATCFGGGIIAFVWLEPSALSGKMGSLSRKSSWIVGGFALLTGLFLCLFPDSFPRMFDQSGDFAIAAKMVNVLGGIGYFSAAFYFLDRFRLLGTEEDLTFLAQCSFLGVAGVLFSFSKMWDGTWWLFHFLRFFSYLIVLSNVFFTFRKMQKDVISANIHLERRVNHRTRALESAMADLQESQDQFRVLADSIPPLAWIANSDGQVTWYNQRWIDYTGKDVPAMGGNAWREAVPTENLGQIIRSFNQSLSSGTAWDETFPIIGKSGQERRYLSRALPIRGKSGEVMRWFGTSTDIEDQLLATELIQNAREKLEIEVGNRTRALTESNTALEAVNRELESFSYSISHDLRSPLRGIHGFSEALAQDYKEVLDQTGQKYLAFIQEGVKKMGVLIDDILSLSRISRVDLRISEIDVSQLTLQILSRLERETPALDFELEVEPGIRLMADPGLVSIILENLLGNAWKFSSKNPSPLIQVGTLTMDGTSVIFVKDNGAGFDMTYYEKLFGVFQRLHSVKEFSGTGIGLATVKRAVLRQGGKIWAESKIGEGSTFYFILSKSPLGPSSAA